jgi:hypothetical protein
MRFVVLSLLLAGTAAAAEPWKKSPEKWTDQDLAQILVDSPWAQQVEVRLPPAELPPGPPVETGTNTAMQQAQGAARNGTMGPLGQSVRGKNAGGGRPPSNVRIRFESALPLRLAVAKTRFGSQFRSLEEGRQLIEKTPEEYSVVVDNLPPYLDRREGAATIENMMLVRSLLIVGKNQIRPTAVNVRANSDGLVVTLKFSRLELPISEKDGVAEFRTLFGSLDIRAKFKLATMLYQGKLEL